MKLNGLDAYYRGRFGAVPGWMHTLDLELFDRLLAEQLCANVTGDILEIGSYFGKSAIALGYGLRGQENLVVCDLFGRQVEGVPTEGIDAYDGLTVSDFESQYRRFHSRQPVIHAVPSTELDLGDEQLFRFIHIDGGHAYAVVSHDITLAVQHAKQGTLVALDDYRSSHTPGVAAAVWEATGNKRLFPFLLSEVKLYAATSLDDQQWWLDAARKFDLPREEHSICGLDVVRMWR